MVSAVPPDTAALDNRVSAVYDRCALAIGQAVVIQVRQERRRFMSISIHTRRLALAFLGAVLVVLLAACGDPDIAINGIVTDKYTGKPVSSAMIKLGTNEVTTDGNG